MKGKTGTGRFIAMESDLGCGRKVTSCGCLMDDVAEDACLWSRYGLECA